VPPTGSPGKPPRTRPRSRTWPARSCRSARSPARRPQAAALLAALADPDCAFDAIVVGEYERAFYGSQYALMTPLFEHYGVQLWLPEAGGRVDFAAEGDEQLMLALGVQSKREITRTKIRVRTAIRWQADPDRKAVCSLRTGSGTAAITGSSDP
jgi:hypothetical protein